MPRGDQTGPAGFGPMTGRRMGICAGNQAPGAYGYGRGRAMGNRGGGRGWRNRFYASGQPGWGWAPAPTPTREEEVDSLKGQARDLQAALDQVSARIRELEPEE